MSPLVELTGRGGRPGRGLTLAGWLAAALVFPAAIAMAQAPPDPPPSDAPPAGSGAAGAPAGSGAAGAAGAAGGVGPDAGLSVYASCVEHLPDGAARPKVKETFPRRGLAGHALALEVVIEHGGGETVLPNGLSLQSTGLEADALTKAGFMLPSPDGGAPPTLEQIASTGNQPGGTRTRLLLNFVALPKSPGRHEMVLPSLPITVSRASGELMTLCTEPHAVTVDDPTASTPDARPRPNPPPRPQRETWEAARTAVEMLAVALVAAVAGALLYRWWRRRPRPVPPPPPPRPAWDVALEALVLLREGPLLRDGRHGEYVDGVSDIARRYLGDRYGFDGLEATSREIRQKTRAITPPLPVLGEIDRLLDEADLIKFARVVPSEDDCESLFSLALAIVQKTVPAVVAPGSEAANAPPGSSGPGGASQAGEARQAGDASQAGEASQAAPAAEASEAGEAGEKTEPERGAS
jgi:hypothetical protein